MKRWLNSLRAYLRVTKLAFRALRRSPNEFFERAAKSFARDEQAALEEQVVVDSLPNVVPMHVAVTSGQERYLNVLIPGMVLRAMSGGPNTALNLTYRLAREGVPVRYISTDVPPEEDQELIFEHLRRLTGIDCRFPHVEIANGRDARVAAQVGIHDVFFGTAWWTVQMIKHALPLTRNRRFIYFIQDFEPGFYAWSTVQALALETYRLDFSAIVNESLLLEHLVEQDAGRFTNDSSVSFEPAVDRSLFFVDKSTRPARRRLLFYARPSAPRNLFELGLVALKRAADRGAFPPDEWELLFMGERVAPARLNDSVVIRPLDWLDYDGYGRLLRSADVGLALMLSPHTGYPTIEMAACGVQVITNTYSVKTVDRLREISPNITAVDATADAVADALVEVAARANVGSAGRSGECALPGSWDEVFDPLIPTAVRMIEECVNADDGDGHRVT